MVLARQAGDSSKLCVSLTQLLSLQHLGQSLPRPFSGLANHSLFGRHLSSVKGSGMDFQELKLYHTGDDVRYMDWKATQRFQEPVIRTYNEERERPVKLIVDQSLSMYFASQGAMKSVYAVEFAATIAWHSLYHNDLLSAVVFNDLECKTSVQSNSKEGLVQLLNCLSRFNAYLPVLFSLPEKANTQQLTHVLASLVKDNIYGHKIYLISDLQGVSESTLELLRLLAKANELIVVLVSDVLEQSLPKAKRLFISNREQQFEFDASSKGVREAYQQQFKAKLEQLKKLAQQTGLKFSLLETSSSLKSQLGLR